MSDHSLEVYLIGFGYGPDCIVWHEKVPLQHPKFVGGCEEVILESIQFLLGLNELGSLLSDVVLFLLEIGFDFVDEPLFDFFQLPDD